jgi:hypothetical protein
MGSKTGNIVIGLILGGDSLQLFAYSDADWAGDVDTRRSTSGHIVQLGQSSVAWGSSLQKCATLSSFSAESVALVKTAEEVVWARHFLQSIGYAQSTPTPIYEDNQSTIAALTGKKCPNRVKHIGVRFTWLVENIEASEFTVLYCPTTEMPADIFTKALGRTLFEKHRAALNLKVAGPLK